jgi:hypothetical protein
MEIIESGGNLRRLQHELQSEDIKTLSLFTKVYGVGELPYGPPFVAISLLLICGLF